jgi:hypothetical protein
MGGNERRAKYITDETSANSKKSKGGTTKVKDKKKRSKIESGGEETQKIDRR